MKLSLVTDIWDAIRIVFSNPKYIVVGIIAWIIYLVLFAYLAIFSVPANDVEFFLSISKPEELIGIGLLTLGMSIVTTMNVKLIRINHSNVKSAGLTVGGLAANLTSLVLISATCAACLVALAGVIAAPILTMLLEYRPVAIGISVVLLGISLHYASAKILDKCEFC
jgi:hypothetical protein